MHALRDLTREIDSLPKGTSFARFCLSLLRTGGDTETAARYAEKHFNFSTPSVARALRVYEKAAVSAGTTADATWAGPLADLGGIVTQFLAALAPRTIIGRIPGMVRVPFLLRFVMQTDTASGAWVGEGQPIPVAALAFNYSQLHPTKVAIITVLSEEMARFEGPAGETFMLNALQRSHTRLLDASFIDPASAGTPEIEPAAVTYGAPGLASTGSTIAAAAADGYALQRILADLGSDGANAVYVMNPRSGAYLGSLIGSGGMRAFPGLSMRGGTWLDLPVITSTAVPVVGSPGLTTIALVDGSRILIADDGQVEIERSRNAALQMLDNPTNNVTTPTPTNMVSMFQTECVALKSQRVINWSAQTGAAAVLTGVAY